MADEDEEEMRRIFDELDTDNSGFLERSEVRTMATTMGLEVSDSEVDDAMAEISGYLSGVGAVTYESFARWFREQQADVRDSNGAFVTEAFSSRGRDRRAHGSLPHDRAFEQVEALHQVAGVGRCQLRAVARYGFELLIGDRRDVYHHRRLHQLIAGIAQRRRRAVWRAELWLEVLQT